MTTHPIHSPHCAVWRGMLAVGNGPVSRARLGSGRPLKGAAPR